MSLLAVTLLGCEAFALGPVTHAGPAIMRAGSAPQMSDYNIRKQANLHLDYEDFRHGRGAMGARPLGGLGHTATTDVLAHAAAGPSPAHILTSAPTAAAPSNAAAMSEEAAKQAWLARVDADDSVPRRAAPPTPTPAMTYSGGLTGEFSGEKLRREGAAYAQQLDTPVLSGSYQWSHHGHRSHRRGK